MLETSSMTARPVAEVRLDHLIVFARDKRASAELFAEMFGLVAPVVAGSFVQVRLTDGRILDFAEPGIGAAGQRTFGQPADWVRVSHGIVPY